MSDNLAKKPIIGIIPTFNLTNEANDPYQDRASFVSMYSEKIKKSGGIPIGILEDANLYTSICDGYLWPGGSKILQEYIPVLEDAIKNSKPLLGICLGAQTITTVLNVVEDQKENPSKSFKEIYDLNKETNPYLKKLENGNNHQHFVTKEISSIDNARHKIKLKKESLLYEIFECDDLEVVSLHGMAIARTPKNVVVSAKAEDAIIEAVEYKENGALLVGVQFHPEIEEQSPLFDWLVSSTQKYLILVNRENPIKYYQNYKIVPYHSKYPGCKRDSNLEENTAIAWKKFQNFLKENDYHAEVESAYRTKELQEEIYKRIEKEEGKEYARNYVAKPGYSEHELGLAIDVCLQKDGKWFWKFDKELDTFFAFLKEHCADFGFILRYPKGKEEITKYNYEPWHIRYVGSISIAKEIMDNNSTLEEYLKKL